MAIEAGMSHTCETMVDQHNVAKSVGSGRVDVFSPPMMILLIEQAETSAQMKNTLRACRVFLRLRPQRAYAFRFACGDKKAIPSR